MINKDTNPKDAVGSRKAGIAWVSAPVITEIGVAMSEGARKYGPYNWRDASVRFSVYYDAMWRHMTQWWEGEDIDTDSGLHHITKLLSCASVLRDAQLHNKVVDDRPKPTPAGWLAALNERAANVVDTVPNIDDVAGELFGRAGHDLASVVKPASHLSNAIAEIRK